MFISTIVSMFVSALLEDCVILFFVETGKAVAPLGGGLRQYLIPWGLGSGGLLANVAGSAFGAIVIYSLYVGIAYF